GSMARPTSFRCTRAATKAPQRGLCQMALSAEAQELRDRIIEEYDFSPAELAVLDEGLEAWDTAVEAQKAVDEHAQITHRRHGRIIEEYGFSPAELAVLAEGLEAWDTAVEAQKAVEEHGVVIRDRFGQIVRTRAVGIAKDARAQFMAAMKQLGVADPYGGQSTHGRDRKSVV